MSTATKLSYLAETKSQLKDMINYGGGNITNETTFRNYVKALFNAFIESLNNPFTLWSNLPHKTGTGTEITLNDTIEAPMKVDLLGNTSQTQYTGKNLANSEITELQTRNTTGTWSSGIYTLNGVAFTPIYKDGLLEYVNVNGTASADANFYFGRLTPTSVSTSYTLNGCPSGGSTTTYRQWLDYVGGDYGSSAIGVPGVATPLSIFIQIKNGYNAQNLKFKTMVRLTSITDNTYEPYVGGTASPNPSYPSPVNVVSGDNTINVCGKNLFDETYYNNNSLYQNNIYRYVRTTFKANGQRLYTKASLKSGKTAISGLYMCISTAPNPNTSGGTYSMFITNGSIYNGNFAPSQGTTLYFSFYPTSVDVSTIFDTYNIWVSNTDTSYTLYTGNSYEVNLGKNLLSVPFTKYTSGTLRSEIPNFQPGTYTFSLEMNAPGNQLTARKIVNGTTTQITLAYNSKKLTFTLDETATLQLEVYKVGLELTDISNEQLEKGAEATSYAPYFTPIELCKIGTYQDYIRKSTGINLYNKKTITTGSYVNASTGVIASITGTFATDYIEIKPSTSYYWNDTGNRTNAGAFYNESKTYISGISARTFTSPSNAKYVRLTGDSSIIDTGMLNEGTISLPYEPYGKVWYLHKEIGKVVLDGSESWVKYSALDTTNNNCYYISLDTLYVDSTGATQLCLSNYFTGVSFNNKGTDTPNIWVSKFAKQLYLKIQNTITTTAQLQTWLSTHNTIVYYVLATPTTTEITDTNIIKELNRIHSETGQTNITQENNDLPFELNAIALEDLN